MPIPVPSIDEQKLIIAQLNKQLVVIESLVNKFTEEISLLHEYRTRLISDVVTGKLDVRGVTVPEYEAVADTANDTDMDEGGISEDG